MAKGWFNNSEKHRLARLGISTGRKLIPKKSGQLTVVGKSQKMFYPNLVPNKKIVKVSQDTEDITIEAPLKVIRTVGEVASGKKVGRG